MSIVQNERPTDNPTISQTSICEASTSASASSFGHEEEHLEEHSPEYCPVAVLTTSMSLAELQRDVDHSTTIYTHIQRRIGYDVAISELEDQFGFRWCQVDSSGSDGRIHRHDPLYSQHISAAIGTSMRNFIFALSAHLAILPGLAHGQSLDTMQQAVNHACNVLINTMVPLMGGTSQSNTHERLAEAVQQVAGPLIAEHTTARRDVLATQIGAVRALQHLCTQALGSVVLSALLYDNSEALRVLALYPPHQLTDELERHAIPLYEIASFLVADLRPEVRGAASLPPSGAVRELSIWRWISSYGQAALQCCVSALQTLRSLANAIDGDSAWHGIHIDSKNSDTVSVAMLTGGPAAVACCPRMHHSHGADNLVLISMSISEPDSLLIPRIVHALCTMINLRAITPRSAKAECLLPLVRRWQSDMTIERDSRRANAGMDDEMEDDRQSDMVSESSSSSVGFATAKRTLSAVQPIRIFPGEVTLSLERDHAIMVCLIEIVDGLEKISPHSAYWLPVRKVVDRVQERAKDALQASDRSVQQATGHVFNKLIKQTNEKVTCDGWLFYWKVGDVWPDWTGGRRPTGAGILMSEEGHRCISTVAGMTIEQMRTNGTLFSKEWFNGRSSKSHAQRVLHHKRTHPHSAP